MTHFVSRKCFKKKLKCFKVFQGKISNQFKVLSSLERRTFFMDFIPYKANECLENVYYQIPNELFINSNYNKYKDGNIFLVFL